MKAVSFLFFFPFIVLAQHNLTVNVTNVKSTDGKISIAVYDDPEGFLEFDKVFKVGSNAAEKENTKVVIKDLPKGTYAVAVFHDENANDELDRNIVGIPKEPLGFSKGKMKTFGPPSFEECSLEVKSDQTISVAIK